MSQQKLFIPVFGTLAKKLEPVAIPLLRLVAGFVFIFHGYGKFMGVLSGEGPGPVVGMVEGGGLPFPLLWAYMATVTEFIGGICIVLGLFTRLWAFLGAGMMIMIVVFVRGFGEIHYLRGGFEYDLVLAMVFGILFVYGSGGFSIDSNLKKTF